MADTAHNDPEAVRRLSNALGRYLREAHSGTESVGFARAKVGHELTVESNARRRTLEHAQQAYARCLAGDDDCRAERYEVDRAAAALAAADRAQRIFATAAGEYDGAVRRFFRVVTALQIDATRKLGQIAADLDSYQRSSSAVPGGFASGAAGFGGRADPVPGGGGAADGVVVPPGFPDGFGLVPLSQIDTGPSRVHGPADFKRDVTPADLEWGLETLHRIILPALARGKDLEYFRDRDLQENRYGSRSYADTYTGFFDDNEAVRLARGADGRYAVENGYHRIWVAQRMGLTSIPGRVVGS